MMELRLARTAITLSTTAAIFWGFQGAVVPPDPSRDPLPLVKSWVQSKEPLISTRESVSFILV